MERPACTGPGDEHMDETFIPKSIVVDGKYPYLCKKCLRKFHTTGLPYQWPPPGHVTSSNPLGQ